MAEGIQDCGDVLQPEFDAETLEVPEIGDGYVEIENAVAVGGIAVGVATDEVRRSGVVDAWKRERLIRAGAQLIIPDFRHAEALVRFLFAEE